MVNKSAFKIAYSRNSEYAVHAIQKKFSVKGQSVECSLSGNTVMYHSTVMFHCRIDSIKKPFHPSEETCSSHWDEKAYQGFIFL